MNVTHYSPISHLIVTPSAVVAIADTANPEVVLGSMEIVSEPAYAIPSSRQFTYQMAGKVYTKYEPD